MDKLTDLLTSIIKRLERLESNTGASRMVFPKASSAPSSPIEGEVYFDTTLHKARCWDGTSWQNMW